MDSIVESDNWYARPSGTWVKQDDGRLVWHTGPRVKQIQVLHDNEEWEDLWRLRSLPSAKWNHSPSDAEINQAWAEERLFFSCQRLVTKYYLFFTEPKYHPTTAVATLCSNSWSRVVLYFREKKIILSNQTLTKKQRQAGPLLSIKKNRNTHVGHYGEMASWQMRGLCDGCSS